jgi:hypothetical protein
MQADIEHVEFISRFTASELRKRIDNTQNDRETRRKAKSAKEILSTKYVSSVQQGGLEFDSDDAKYYLIDFVARDISYAENFVNLAIEEDPESIRLWCADLNKYYQSIAIDEELKADKLNQLEQILERVAKEISDREKGLTRKQAELAYHYVNDPDDPYRFEYDITMLSIYIQHWAAGISTAESYVIRALQEDPLKFKNTFHSIKNLSTAEKALDLMLRYLDENNEADLSLLQYKKILAAATPDTREKAANEIEEALRMGILSEFLKPNTKDFFTKDVLIPALPFINDFWQLLDLCKCMGEVNRHLAERTLYKAYLKAEPDENDRLILALETLNEFWKSEGAKEKVSDEKSDEESERLKIGQPIFIRRIAKEIRLDFYIASLKKNTANMIELAFDNPQQFTELLLKEMNLLTNQALQKREAFVRELLLSLERNSFYYYGECVQGVNPFLKEAGLQLIHTEDRKPLQYGLKTTINEELGDDNLSDAVDIVRKEKQSRPNENFLDSVLPNLQNNLKSFFTSFLNSKSSDPQPPKQQNGTDSPTKVFGSGFFKPKAFLIAPKRQEDKELQEMEAHGEKEEEREDEGYVYDDTTGLFSQTPK